MKTRALILTTMITALMISFTHSQEMKTYKHPELEFSFTSSGHWENVPYHNDKMIYEMVNEKMDIHVMLWYTGGTEMDCERYLLKMADMKGIQCGDIIQEEITGETIWTLECQGTKDDQSLKKILAALSYIKPYGDDAPERCVGKNYNAIHIAQVWCPADKFEENKKMMDDIVASLELKGGE